MKVAPQFELTELALDYLRPRAGVAPWAKAASKRNDNRAGAQCGTLPSLRITTSWLHTRPARVIRRAECT